MIKTKPKKTGFTIIEVSLFLALSGFLMVGIIVSANRSIARQRYTDSVNNFAEFVRGAYTDTLNVMNLKDPSDAESEAGRTKTAVYGKVISIGEDPEIGSDESPDTIYEYDLVGTAVNSSSVSGANVLEILNSDKVKANIFDTSKCTNPASCRPEFYRMETYTIPWQAKLQKPDGTQFKGVIIVVRSPVTGSLRTYTYDKGTENFHSMIDSNNAAGLFQQFLNTVGSSDNNRGENTMDICIDSDDNHGNRRNIRISLRANNSSGVMLADLDNAFDATNNPKGSKCL